MSEDRLSRAAAAGVRARSLLEDDLLQGAFSALEERYLQAWRATAIDDVAARETLFKAIHVIGKVRIILAASSATAGWPNASCGS